VRHLFPNLPILARARNRQHYYDLYALGIRRIYRETFASALEVGVDAVVSLGMRAATAHRLARKFRDRDEQDLEALGKLWDDPDESNYFAAARQAREEMERLLRQEKPSIYTDDSAWDNESLRRDVIENAERR
jgi:glutathione-regulated potassium-efflux system ancillary protein KefC